MTSILIGNSANTVGNALPKGLPHIGEAPDSGTVPESGAAVL